MLALVRFVAKWFGFELMRPEEVAGLRELAKDADGVKAGQLREFRAFVEGGECRYAVIAIDGGNPGKYWPIDVNVLVGGGIRPEWMPLDWRPYFVDLQATRVLVVPQFLAEQMARPEGSLASIGIKTPASLDVLPERQD